VRQIESAVATYAGAGPLAWRKPKAKPAGDVELLLSLPSVQDQLASFDGDLQTDLNAAADAIEAAIRLAIETRLSSPYLDAALEHFGLIAHPDLGATPLSLGDREELAAKKLGRTTQRWYTTPGKEHDGLKPRDYVVALVTCALCGIDDPISYIADREQDGAPIEADIASAESHLKLRQHGTYSRRTVLIAAAIATVMLIGAGVWMFSTASGGGKGDALATPPLGSVVDAQTGKVSPASSLPAHPAATAGQLGGGHTIQACIVGRTGCAYPLRGQPVMARPGDILLVNLTLHNPDATPLSEAKISVAVSRQAAGDKIFSSYEWPDGNRNSDDIETTFSTALVISFTDHQAHGLSYVPGSSVLYDSLGEGHPLAHLPDGVVSIGGITLTDVGAPRSCWDCDLTNIRYVVFEMKVV
jgi:hypothetical protein